MCIEGTHKSTHVSWFEAYKKEPEVWKRGLGNLSLLVFINSVFALEIFERMGEWRECEVLRGF